MFDECEDGALLDVMGTAQRQERAALARQLLAVGQYTVRRIAQQSDEHNFWCIDGWEQIAAEVSAELGISRKRASAQMHYGQSLIERVPQLGAVFAAGAVDFRVIAVVIYRTDLITDPAVLAGLDTQLAGSAPSWNKLSRNRVAELVDWMVIDADPDALRVATQRDTDRHIDVRPGPNGTAENRHRRVRRATGRSGVGPGAPGQRLIAYTRRLLHPNKKPPCRKRQGGRLGFVSSTAGVAAAG